jgi:hypothetical protein
MSASQNNGANKNISLGGGLISSGDYANIQIGLQNLLSSKNNAAGSKIVSVDGDL